MIVQEQPFFSNRRIYITNTRLVVRNRGTYMIANLSQVASAREGGRVWIAPVLIGLFFLTVAVLLYINAKLATFSPIFQGDYYLRVAIGLFLLSLASFLFQKMFPVYVVVVKGSFGTEKPIKSRDGRYILKIVAALNEAMSSRTAALHQQSYHIDQSVHDSSHHIIGPGAQAIIGNSGNASIGPPGWGNGPVRPGESGWEPFSRAQPDPRAFAAQPSYAPQGHNPAARAGAGVRKVIISYYSEDRRWLERLRTQLVVLERQQKVVIWDDSQIQVGSLTREVIENELNSASFAILLVSAGFLASEAIAARELPSIFARYQQRQLALLPLILSPCSYQESVLGPYRAFNPDKPLSVLSVPQQEVMLVHVVKEIQKIIDPQ